jgi:uncharacterized membrane protein
MTPLHRQGSFGTRVLAASAAVLLLLVSGATGAGVGRLAAAGPAPSPTPAPSTSPWYRVDARGDVLVDLYFGWLSTCPHCARARPFVERLAVEKPWLVVHSLQLDGDNAANLRLLTGLAAGIGEQIGAVPAFLFGGRLTTGFDTAETTGAQLAAELEGYRAEVVGGLRPAASPTPQPSAASGYVTVPVLGRVAVGSVSLPLLTVVLAGLDAFNPCALSVLLFLLSVLVGARSRARMALVGGTFVLVSGLAYFAFMAAWLNLFLLVGELRLVTVAAGAAATIAALINIKDYVWFRRGISLMIPDSARPRIFGRMLDLGESTKLSAVLAGTFAVAVAVNAYEMLCTGGFPVVFTRILTLRELPTGTYYLYLLLYNVVYVVPLLLVVGAFTWTLGSRGISELEARRLKLLSGLLMLGLGLLLLLAPERLMDLTASLAIFGVAVGVTTAAVVAERVRSRRSVRSRRGLR